MEQLGRVTPKSDPEERLGEATRRSDSERRLGRVTRKGDSEGRLGNATRKGDSDWSRCGWSFGCGCRRRGAAPTTRSTSSATPPAGLSRAGPGSAGHSTGRPETSARRAGSSAARRAGPASAWPSTAGRRSRQARDRSRHSRQPAEARARPAEREPGSATPPAGRRALDAVRCQFELYLTVECVCMLVAPLCCDGMLLPKHLQTVKLRRTPPLRGAPCRTALSG